MSTTGVKHRTWAQKRRREVLTALGGQCVQCGIADYRVLQIDHVNGGGSKEHKTMSRTTFITKVLADKDDNYQLLCANCNWIKRFDNNEHPKSKFGSLTKEKEN